MRASGNGTVVVAIAGLFACVLIVALFLGRGFTGQVESDKVIMQVEPAGSKSVRK